MQKLDRYVSSCFISSYGICLLFFLGMFVLIDLFSKSDDLFANASAIEAKGYAMSMLLAQFYGLRLPFIFLQVAPFVTVMAAMFAITRLRRSNELVPMINAGRSLFRILAPIYIFSILLAVFMGLVQQYVAPGLADQRWKLDKLLFSGKDRRVISGNYPLDNQRWVHVQDYDVDAQRIAWFDVTDVLSDEPSLTGSNARWDAEKGLFVYDVLGPKGKVVKTNQPLPVNIDPSIIESQQREPFDLSYSQAQYLFDRTGLSKWKVLLHYHLTFPLSNLLLLLLGLPFVLQLGSRSLLLGMVIAILICGVYFAVDAVMRNMGDKEVLHPVLAAWFGIILFGSFGVVMLDNVRT